MCRDDSLCFRAYAEWRRSAGKMVEQRMPTHPLNWFGGWVLILIGFASGSLLGLFFHREEFLGGYASFRRRIIRLGHIALVALGMMNVLFGISPGPTAARWQAQAGSICFLAGGIAMPAVCFLTGWRGWYQRFFLVPVALLVSAVVLILIGALP